MRRKALLIMVYFDVAGIIPEARRFAPAGQRPGVLLAQCLCKQVGEGVLKLLPDSSGGMAVAVFQ